jgi:tetratricopeptide (TPR) repeat protein
MNALLRLNFLMVCAVLTFGARTFADETNSAASPMPSDAANGYLQIQAQLHDTQLALEKNRQLAEAEAKHNADEMTARIEALQQTIAALRANEIAATQKTQQLTLILAGTFGVIGLGVMLLMAYAQWRTVTRLVELSPLPPRPTGLGNSRPPPRLESGAKFASPTPAAIELSNTRLLGVVGRLEKRILELEHTARAPMQATAPAAVNGQNGTPAALSDRDERIVSLLAKGQSLAGANELEQALKCFDEALGLQPKHAEALVKKGDALEKLERLDEAIACYDRALEANDGMVIAYLHKGGLFNRLARYDEALQCYEQALRTQEKKTPTETAAA